MEREREKGRDVSATNVDMCTARMGDPIDSRNSDGRRNHMQFLSISQVLEKRGLMSKSLVKTSSGAWHAVAKGLGRVGEKLSAFYFRNRLDRLAYVCEPKWKVGLAAISGRLPIVDLLCACDQSVIGSRDRGQQRNACDQWILAPANVLEWT